MPSAGLASVFDEHLVRIESPNRVVICIEELDLSGQVLKVLNEAGFFEAFEAGQEIKKRSVHDACGAGTETVL